MIDTSALVAAERAATRWDEFLARLGGEPGLLPAIVWKADQPESSHPHATAPQPALLA